MFGSKQIVRLFLWMRGVKATRKLVSSYLFFILMVAILGYVGVSQAIFLARVNQQLFDRNLTGVSSVKEAAIFQAKCGRVLRDAVLAIGDKSAVDDQRQVLPGFDIFAEAENVKRFRAGQAEQAVKAAAAR